MQISDKGIVKVHKRLCCDISVRRFCTL